MALLSLYSMYKGFWADTGDLPGPLKSGRDQQAKAAGDSDLHLSPPPREEPQASFPFQCTRDRHASQIPLDAACKMRERAGKCFRAGMQCTSPCGAGDSALTDIHLPFLLQLKERCGAEKWPLCWAWHSGFSPEKCELFASIFLSFQFT